MALKQQLLDLVQPYEEGAGTTEDSILAESVHRHIKMIDVVFADFAEQQRAEKRALLALTGEKMKEVLKVGLDK